MRNELATETQTLAGQAARVVSYSYDVDGLRDDMTAPSGRLVEYAWTTRAQLAAVTADGPPPFADYEYDKAGRLLKTIHENGITEEREYDPAGQLLANLHKQAGTTVSGHGYTYDLTGRRTAETFPGSPTAPRTYGYDTADQVTSANYGNSLTDAYNYDAMGNRTSATVASQSATFTYTANNANQYTSITGLVAPPIHDANGNLLSQNGVNYTWDSENRLLSVSDGTTTNTFSYDGNHRRVTKRTAVSGTVTEKTHFIYDGWNVIEEYTNADTTPGFNLTTFAIARTYTWGNDLSGTLQGAGGVGGLLLTEEIDGANTVPYYFHYDGNGNVTEITTTNSASAATYRYDAFGNTLVATGSYAATNKYRFSTKPIDSEIANATLYYYGYRYYDPATGRWPSRDPIEENGGINLYGFVGNDGVNQWDYLGMAKGVLRLSLMGAGDVDVFGYGEVFGSRDVTGAVEAVISHYDKDDDGKLTDKDCPPFRVKVIGYSWGGWSALEFTSKIGKKVDDPDENLLIGMGTLDPVKTLRGSKAPSTKGLPAWVVKAYNFYQTNGMWRARFQGIGPIGAGLFKGLPVTGAVNTDWSSSKPDPAAYPPGKGKNKDYEDHISITRHASALRDLVDAIDLAGEK